MAVRIASFDEIGPGDIKIAIYGSESSRGGFIMEARLRCHHKKCHMLFPSELQEPFRYRVRGEFSNFPKAAIMKDLRRKMEARHNQACRAVEVQKFDEQMADKMGLLLSDEKVEALQERDKGIEAKQKELTEEEAFKASKQIESRGMTGIAHA